MAERDDGFDGRDRSGDEVEPVSVPGVTDGGVPDLDEFLRVLSDRRRRCALYCLWEDDLRDLDALAKHVAARLERTSPEEVSESQYEEAKVALIHIDVPLLEETGVVSYDQRNENLCLDYPPAPLETLLDACATLDEYADRPDGSDGSGDGSFCDR